MSAKKNPLALRQTNVFERERNKATMPAAGKRKGIQTQSEDENGHRKTGDSRRTTSKATSKSDRHRADRVAAEKSAIQEQYLKELEQKKTDVTRLGNIGRIIARLYLPFQDLNDPLHWALKRQAGHRLDKEQKKLALLGDGILEDFDDLPDLIAKYGLFYVETTLTKARNNARTADTYKIRNIIMKCHNWGIEQEDWNDKSKRGWAHEEMAKLLFPDHSLYSVGAVQRFADGDAHCSEKDIPCLVYADGNPDDMAGFLRGDYLLKAGSGLLQGSQAATSGCRASSNTARKHHITSVTEVFIIYVICLVRFALSDEKNFTPEGAEGFDYLKFFDTLANEIKKFKATGRHGAGALAVNEIIEHWNRSIFASRRKPDNENDLNIQAVSASYQVERRLKWAAHAEEQMAARAAEGDADIGSLDGDEVGKGRGEDDGVPLFLEGSDAAAALDEGDALVNARDRDARAKEHPADEDEDEESGSADSTPRSPKKATGSKESSASLTPSPRASHPPAAKRKHAHADSGSSTKRPKYVK